MRRRTLVASTILGAALLLGSVAGAHAGGVGFGPFVYTIDVTGTFAKVPAAAEAAFVALDGAFADFGVPQADRDAIRQGLEEGLDAFEETLDLLPTLFPLPLLAGSIEISLPLVIVDGVRLSVGFLSDGLLRGVADLAGLSIPSPLVDVDFEEDGLSGGFEGDLAFSSWVAATELTKRLDILVAALTLGVGVQWVGGEATPSVEIDVPAELADGVAEAVAALHLDGFTWSAFAAHASIGVEIGPPFLRLGAEIRFVLPVSATSGWWDVRVGGIGGSLGIVIRF
jgi:hypothetical protein